VSGSFNDERPFFRVYEGATGHFWRKAVVDLLTGISPTHEAKISIKTLRASGARGWEMFSKPPIYA
jgi:hypothetical protein